MIAYRMRSEASTLVAIVFTAILVAGGLACPFWMASISHCDTHGSPENCDSPDQCSMGACVAESPRLLSHVSASRVSGVVLEAASAADGLPPAPGVVRPLLASAPAYPAGPIFLRTCSFLI
jgi:hypothetical protein